MFDDFFELAYEMENNPVFCRQTFGSVIQYLYNTDVIGDVETEDALTTLNKGFCTEALLEALKHHGKQ